MKRALILTYYWPPGSGPGVQRWLKFCKFLPEFGWEPTVITVKDGSYPSLDPSLEEDVPADLQVIKTSTLEPFRVYNLLRGRKGKAVEVGMASVKGNPGMLARVANFVRSNYFIPDARMGWNSYAIKAAKELIERQRPDVIITTGPPHSTHLAGMKLHQQFQIPWVSDFRDPWTNIYYNSLLSRTERAKQKDKNYEQAVVSTTSALLAATPGLKSEFEQQTSQTWMIPNGYDEGDFEALDAVAPKKFTMAYVGNFKPQQNIPAFWRSLQQLIKDDAFAKHFELRLTGNVSEEVKQAIREHGLESVVSVEPFVPHKESIARMMAAHILLLPVPQGETSKHILTGKIFEYLATQRPIFAIGPVDGNAGQVIQSCEKDAMIDYSDEEAMSRFVRKYFDAFLQDQTPKTTGNEHYKTFSRKGCTEQLASHLDQLTSGT